MQRERIETSVSEGRNERNIGVEPSQFWDTQPAEDGVELASSAQSRSRSAIRRVTRGFCCLGGFASFRWATLRTTQPAL